MLQGTGSDVGKSLLVAGLCRAYTRRGLRVRPFKPQNMSNNAAITPDGREIGRAQALQAQACGVPPCADMNPVLLKPQTDIGAQVVVQGRVWGNARAQEYHALRTCLLPAAIESFARLAAACDLVLVEGAGSPAEVNLRAGDIANMGFASAVDVPVVLVGDIARGGVIASLVGTWMLLAPEERTRLKGFIVNKFRGDPALFYAGIRAIEQRTGLPSLGVVPYFADAHRLPAEDAVALEHRRPAGERAIRIAVLVLQRIANFDDLDPLAGEPDVSVRFVHPGEALPGDVDLVVLPGTKATLADLAHLRAEGWDIDVLAHRRRGGWILGICGGYQMLGRVVADPSGIEGAPGGAPGLHLLEVETELAGEKILVPVAGIDEVTGEAVRGYEMHVGRTSGPGTKRAMLRLEAGRADGAVSADGRVMGCYLHGLFAADRFRHAFLNRLRERRASETNYEAEVDSTLDKLALHLAAHLDLDQMLELAHVA